MIPFDEKIIPYLIPLPTKLASFLEGRAVKNVLEIGCGYGRACFYLRENGYEIVGVDLDRVQIKSALREASSRSIKGEVGFIIGDARILCLRDSSFDAATMLALLTLVSESGRPKVLDEVYGVLKPSGYLFVEEFGRTWENPVYARRYRSDLKVTGEMGTITVNDESGKILHFGHHFTRKELRNLLRRFRIISFEEDVFTSYYHKNWVKGYSILAQKGGR
jgi:ubiquinone/menaquinone biosynthesis C-methylase UbiE